MLELDASLQSQLDTTVLIESQSNQGELDANKSTPLFALVSLNESTAPSVEVPWSQLLAMSWKRQSELFMITVGRHKDCSVALPDPRVSQIHFEIIARRKEADGISGSVLYECVLNDSSSNGTSVNGKIVGKGNSETLHSGDEIVVLAASKVGLQNRIAFVFRNSTESLTSSSDGKHLDIEEHILCPICLQAIYKCVALMPCLHNFCMACYSEWMAREDDCPVCRQLVTSIVRNHPMDAVINSFLEAVPSRRRSEEDLHEMDRNDRMKLSVGGKIVRDTCTVGTSMDSWTSASDRVTQPPPRRSIPDRNRTASTSRGSPGTTVCSLQ